jgi:hypothetical protein
VQLIELLQRLLERHTPIGGVQVEDIDTIRAELLKGLVQLFLNHFRLVGSSMMRVPLGSTSKSALLPLGLAGEGLLLAADVDSGGVDFVVASALEAVKDLVVVVDVGDASALRLVRTKCHGPEDDAGLASASDERHGASGCCGERPEWRGCQWLWMGEDGKE